MGGMCLSSTFRLITWQLMDDNWKRSVPHPLRLDPFVLILMLYLISSSRSFEARSNWLASALQFGSFTRMKINKPSCTTSLIKVRSTNFQEVRRGEISWFNAKKKVRGQVWDFSEISLGLPFFYEKIEASNNFATFSVKQLQSEPLMRSLVKGKCIVKFTLNVTLSNSRSSKVEKRVVI